MKSVNRGMSAEADDFIRSQKLKKVVGQRISSLRDRKGLSQKQLELRSGVDRTQVSEIERGNVNLKFETLYELAKAMHTPLSVLLTGIEFDMGDEKSFPEPRATEVNWLG